MAFPTMNANTVARMYLGSTAATTAASALGLMNTGPNNLVSVPAVVDVSGMEYSFGVAFDSAGAAGLGASTNDASAADVALTDGGATGDNTTVSVLATALTATVAFTAQVPRDVTGTSTTDLDADDWINVSLTGQPTTVAGVAVLDVSLNYIFGKPGSIN